MIKRSVALILSILLLSSVIMSSCATGPSPQTSQGAAVGAALGSVAGILIDDKNRWRGVVIGGLIGGALGGSLSEISQRASREAVYAGRPVAYQSRDGFQKVEASPVGYNAQTNCHKVRERIWQDGNLVKDEVKEICESEKTEAGYQ